MLVGEGPLLPQLRTAAEARGLSGQIVFTGASPVPERLLPLFSVFALSSDTEQMPLSVLEAMAASRAIAATDVGDVRAMLAEENRPFVVAREARPLGEAILALLADPQKTAAIGHANRMRAVAAYDQSHMFAAYRENRGETDARVFRGMREALEWLGLPADLDPWTAEPGSDAPAA